MTASSSRRCLIAAAGFLILSATSGRGEIAASDVLVELNSQKTLSLHVTLRPRADKRVTLYKYRLPWGNRNTMILVAVTPRGQYLDRDSPIDDPSPEQITVEPGELLSGDISLQKKFRGLNAALNKSDIHLFWAYEAPPELNIARQSGGWILITQHH